MVVVLAAAALLFIGPSRALAVPSTNIDLYQNGYANCGYDAGSNANYCLWYSPDMTNGHWSSTQQAVGPIAGVWTNGPDAGNPVRNAAASMADNTGVCHTATWVNANFTGPANFVDGDWGGNLTSNPTFPLRNNEASIDYNSCL